MSGLLIYLSGCATPIAAVGALKLHYWLHGDALTDRAREKFADYGTAVQDPAEPRTQPRHLLADATVTPVTSQSLDGRGGTPDVASAVECSTEVHRNPVFSSDVTSVDVAVYRDSSCWIPPELMSQAS